MIKASVNHFKSGSMDRGPAAVIPNLDDYFRTDADIGQFLRQFQWVNAGMKSSCSRWNDQSFPTAVSTFNAFVLSDPQRFVGRALICGLAIRDDLMMIISDSVHDVLTLSQRSVSLHLDHLGWAHQTPADVGDDRIFGSSGRQLLTEACRFKKLIQFRVLRDATVTPVSTDELTPELSGVLMNAPLEGREAEDPIELDDEMMVRVIEAATEEDLGEFADDPDETPELVQEAIELMLNVAQAAPDHPSVRRVCQLQRRLSELKAKFEAKSRAFNNTKMKLA
jgi:hypothetical protein